MSLLRHLAHPISVLALVGLLIPVRPVDCAGLASGAHERMPCCSRQVDASTALDGGCCNMQESTPLPDRAQTSTAAARRTSSVDDSEVPQLSYTLPVESNPGSETADPDPPTLPLFLRLLVLRR